MQANGPERRQKRGGNVVFIVTFVVFLLGIVIPIAVAPAGAALVFLIFTLPIYAVLAVSPTLSLIGMGGLLTGRLIRRGALFYIAGGLATLGALLYVPYQSNPAAHRKARDLIAGDKLASPAPVRTGTIALVHPARSAHSTGRSLCGDLCRTLLLDGRAQTVLIVLDNDIASGFKPGLEAVGYALESRPTCPDTGKPAYNLPGEAAQSAVGQSSEERLDLAMAQGRCLVARPGVASEADVAAVYGDIEVKKTQTARWFGDGQFTVRRLGLWRRDGTGFIETYRRTYVTYDVYFPVLAPTIILDGTTSYAGFARQRLYARQADKWIDAPPVSERLLGLPERNPPGGPIHGTGVAPKAQVTEDARQVVTRALDAAAKPSPAALAVAKSYLDGMAWGRRAVTPEDAALGTRLLTDLRFPVTSAASGFVKDGRLSPGQASAVADAMFARLHAMDGSFTPEMRGGDTFEEASAIGSVIAELPATDIVRHRSDLMWLAHHETVRAPAYRALSRLDLLGNGLEFLKLIDASGMFGAGRKDSGVDTRYRKHPYLAGIQGLCAMGEKASGFRPALIARIENGTVSRDGSYGDIAFNTLVAMGSPREEMARLFEGTGNFVRVSYEGGGLSAPRRKVTRNVPIDRAYERAQRRKDCSY